MSEKIFTRCEKHEEVTILHTKLDILIDDFKALRKSSIRQEQIAELRTNLIWHTVIGTFMIGLIMLKIMEKI